jgi:hypothetical protein
MNPKNVLRVAALAAALTLQIGSAASAATSLELLNCQKQFESQIRSFTNIIYLRLYGCAQKIVECELASEIDAVDPTACIARAATLCGATPAKVADAQSVKAGKVVQRCGLIPLAEVNQFVEGLGFFNVSAGCSAASVSDLVACVFADARCSTERQLFRIDPRAQDSLTTAGIAGSFPCVAP